MKVKVRDKVLDKIKTRKQFSKKQTPKQPKHPKHNMELLLLLQILVNIIVLFKMNNINKNDQRIKLEQLLETLKNNDKLISSKTTSSQINKFINTLLEYVNLLLISYASNNNKTRKTLGKKHGNKLTIRNVHNGGFFFKNIEDKADQPITGADVTKLLDDIQSFFYNAKYVDEGKFLIDTDAVLSMLRGDTSQFKSVMNYRIFPKYISRIPPFINFGAIGQAIKERKYEDIADYLLAYQTYLRLQDEYLVEKGLKPPSVLNKGLYKGFYNKMAHAIDNNVLKFQRLRAQSQLKHPIMVF